MRRAPVTIAVAAFALGALSTCGPAKGPPGKSVVVSGPSGTPVKGGVYEVGYTNGFIFRGDDGGIVSVQLNAMLTPPGGGSSAGINVTLGDTTVGQEQALGAVGSPHPTMVGYLAEPLDTKSRKIWGATAGTVTVQSFDGGAMAVSVASAKMEPVPGVDGGAAGTFLLEIDLKVEPVKEL